MKFLHTSDWHLGQKFMHNDREEEHALALDWLTETIVKEAIDCLIVAGDIFDIGNPPNYARRLYYRFLTGLQNSCCRHIIITGGNHDSPAMLNAPRDLLEALDVHVLGCATEKPEEEILLLKNDAGKLEGVVAAVPFLRDKDLRHSIPGEGMYERLARVKEGIYRHYEQMGELVKSYKKKKVPILATGHLYAKGASASGKQDNIYIGNMENIAAEQFPKVFDYIALGHLHRAQRVGKQDRIRYCGSLIPLSFAEIKDEKSVFIIEFEKEKLKSINPVPVPVFRKLITIKGSLEAVEKKLTEFDDTQSGVLTTWLEVIVKTEKLIPRLDLRVKELCKDKDVELLKIRLERRHLSLDQQLEDNPDLNELEVLEVFHKKCLSAGQLPEEIEDLTASFLELQEWLKEEED